MGKIGDFLPYLARERRDGREEKKERRKKREERREKKEQMVERTMDRKMAMSDLEMEIEKRDFGAVREHVTR